MTEDTLFKSKLRSEGSCLIYEGSLVKRNGKSYTPRAWAYYLHHGKEAEMRLFVTCMNPSCVNVEHMVWA